MFTALVEAIGGTANFFSISVKSDSATCNLMRSRFVASFCGFLVGSGRFSVKKPGFVTMYYLCWGSLAQIIALDGIRHQCMYLKLFVIVEMNLYGRFYITMLRVYLSVVFEG